MTTTKNVPKDIQVMTNILKEFGLGEYDNGITNHMLEFSTKYVTTIIEDAQLYSTHAKKKSIDVEDVKLAIDLQMDRSFACPPSREITATCARQRNSLPLPTIRSSAGLRLPPDRFSLTNPNAHLKGTAKKSRTVHAISRGNAQNTAPTNSTIPKSNFNIPKAVQYPTIKFSEGNRGPVPPAVLSPMPSNTPVLSSNSSVPSQILMPTVGVLNTDPKLSNDVSSIKRSHEEDDDYDNN